MRNLWLVAKHEFLTVVKERSFLIGTFGLPVFFVVIMAVAILVIVGGRGRSPVGYVDATGIFSSDAAVEGAARVEFRSYADEQSGLAALNAEHIQALYVLPSDYLESHRVTLFYLTKKPGELIQEEFDDFLRSQLLAQQPAEVRDRLLAREQVTIRSADSSREFDTQNPLSFIVPYASAFFFIFAVMNSGGYMLHAVTSEKENRTVEMLATSVRPLDLIGGKALGLMSVGLSQLLLWFGVAFAGLAVAGRFFEEISSATAPWSTLGVIGAFFLPAYALISAMMTAIGSVVEDTRQGQQISGILNLLFTMPFFFIALIMAKPNSPLVVALTLFPTTAFVTMAFRWGMSEVPTWQVVVSWILLVVTSGAGVWAAARIFKVGMLRYGQRLSLKRIWQALRD